MKEISIEIIKTIQDRLKYPIVYIYLVVLILWNWDVISYYILSDDKIKDKIDYINSTYTDTWSRVLLPLIKALVLTIFIPLIMWGIEYLLFKVNNNRRKIKYSHNDFIRAEKLKNAQNEYLISQEQNGSKTIKDWENKVIDLEALLKVEKNNNKTLITQLEENSKHYSGYEISKNKSINESTKRTSEANIKRISEAKYILNVLLKSVSEYIKKDDDSAKFILDMMTKIRLNDEYINEVSDKGELNEYERIQINKVLPLLVKHSLVTINSDKKYKITTLGYNIYDHLLEQNID